MAPASLSICKWSIISSTAPCRARRATSVSLRGSGGCEHEAAVVVEELLLMAVAATNVAGASVAGVGGSSSPPVADQL